MSQDLLEEKAASSSNATPHLGSGTSRNAGIDRIRITLTVLVILHHTAIVYGGSGGWYWRQEPDASVKVLVVFNTINQAYFMGLYFLLAGYYTPRSYARKGGARFLTDRLLRLGVPLATFFFILSPLSFAIARTVEGHPFWDEWRRMTMAHAFGPGPLWFAEALLIFAFCYAGWRAVRGEHGLPALSPTALPSSSVLAVSAIALGVTSFAVRLVVPVGKEVLWLQLGYFPCYIYLFIAGCAAARSRLLESVTLRQAMPWMAVSAAAILLLPVWLFARGSAGGFEGGWTLNALFYALWDPLVAWGVILGLFWAFHRWGMRPTPLAGSLGRCAFGAYVVHAPVVVALSVWAAKWETSSWVKFAIVGAAACMASFAASAALRTIPGVRRII